MGKSIAYLKSGGSVCEVVAQPDYEISREAESTVLLDSLEKFKNYMLRYLELDGKIVTDVFEDLSRRTWFYVLC